VTGPPAALTAARVADVVAGLAQRLGVPGDPDADRVRVADLAAEPLRRHAEDGCRSQLGDDGLPVEWSVKQVGDAFSVRCTVDVLDCRRALDAASTEALAQVAARWAGDGPTPHPDLGVGPAGLVGCLLRDAPPTLAAPMMIGIGVGGSGLARTSVYLRTAFWAAGELDHRLPAVSAAVRASGVPALRGEPEVVGVDFVAGRAVRWKTYHWLPAVRDGLSAAAGGGGYPDLAAVEPLYDRLATALPRAHERAGFLQTTGDGERLRLKAFLFTRAWGWGDPAGLGGLLRALPAAGVPSLAAGARALRRP